MAEAKAIAYAAGLPLCRRASYRRAYFGKLYEHPELEPFCALLHPGAHLSCMCERLRKVYEILGRTRDDDAAEKLMIKVARAIGLGYPGGVKIDRIARGNPDAIKFPKSKCRRCKYDFSFSGLKSAVLNYINGCKMKGESFDPADIAASFQKAVVEMMVEKSCRRRKITVCANLRSQAALHLTRR